MKYTTIILNLIACVGISNAFSVNLQTKKLTVRSRPVLFSSQWDDEDDEVATEPTSFEQAGETLKSQEDLEKMGALDDFDLNPQYRPSDIDRVRAAIKQRTQELGIEESKVSAEMIQEAQDRAKRAIAEKRAGMALDLTQISSTAPRGANGEEIPSMFFEPEDEMTEEEMIEADPDGQLPIIEQVMKEISSAKWPTPGAALKRALLVITIIVSSVLLISYWDNFIREVYTNAGFIPKPEDIMQPAENMVLPDGWTDGMSEDDFMNFQEEVGKVASSVAPDMSGGLPEL